MFHYLKPYQNILVFYVILILSFFWLLPFEQPFILSLKRLEILGFKQLYLFGAGSVSILVLIYYFFSLFFTSWSFVSRSFWGECFVFLIGLISLFFLIPSLIYFNLMEVFCHLCHYGINVPYHLDVKVEDFIGYLMENTQTGEKLKLPAMNGYLGVVGQTHDNQNYLCVNTYKIVDQLVKNDYSKLGIKIGLKFVGVPEVACIGIKPEIIPDP